VGEALYSKDSLTEASMAKYIIGVDTGGTYTDVCVIDETGKVSIGKAPTTPQKLVDGVMDALEDAARGRGISRKELLRNTTSFCQGTTIGTNALINRQGVKTGMITTKGFEDTIYIQRAIGRVDGLHPEEVRHQAAVKKPDPFIPKDLIIGVAERIDLFGRVVVPLQEEEVRRATRKLVSKGVKAIAIAFLWSNENPFHEDEAAKIVREVAPDIFVNTSHKVAPLIREYGRFNSVMIDTYIGPIMTEWYKSLSARLKEEGMGQEMLTAQVWGGVMPYHAMMPIGTINSGPVGGSLGSKRIAELLERPYVVATDVGGTSFDVSVIAQYEALQAREPPIMRYRVNIPMVQITSIGAGGGTIAWVDEANHLRVGPVSAGAYPGPVCYGRGGDRPTVTDALVILGYLNPDYHLGGRTRLDKKGASMAIEGLGKKIGLGALETAKGIFDLQNAHMSDLLRLVVTRSGYDPRDFSLFCYGGGGPLHGAIYGRELGFKEIYMFESSSAWSAFGIATSDISRMFWRHRYLRMPADVNILNETFTQLEAEAIEEMGKIGFGRDEITLHREISMKFGRQVNVETIPVQRKTYSEQEVEEICHSFIEYYKSLYGEGAAFVEAGMEIMSFMVRATKSAILPAIPRLKLEKADSSHALKGKREVFMGDAGEFVPTNVYEFEKLRPGNEVAGPAIVEAPTTTMYVLSEQVGRIDEYRNLMITEE
jgi:N-methylhydantoinase A